MNKLNKMVARGVLSVGDAIYRNGKKFLVVAITGGSAVLAQASTDATSIATDAQTAFSVIAPITITIVGFYVILKIAKRVVQ